ncbi:MAG: ABC transporter permease [Bacteroidota bacterium]
MSIEKEEKNLKITVYSRESGMLNPVLLLMHIFRDLFKSWSLGWRFFKRNLSGQFRQSLLGLIWAFIPPLMSTLVWVFLNGQRIINVEDPGIPYPAFVLTSTLLWSVFAQSLLMPNTVFNQGKSIMTKINFPKESLLISGLFQIGFDFIIKAILIAGVMVVFQVKPSTTILFVPIGVLALTLAGMSLGLLLLPIGMLYTDIQRVLSAILPFWMLLTPVIYPTPREGIAALINKYNPVSPLLSATRDWLFVGTGGYTDSFLMISSTLVLLTIIGLVLFRLAVPFIIERIGS